jgi:hypothetical protein
MKNTHRNVIVLAVAVCFLTLNFIGENPRANPRVRKINADAEKL